jgi:hypothetical protein
VQERHASEQTRADHGLRWKSRDGRRGHRLWLMSIARGICKGRVPRPSAPIGVAFNVHEKKGGGAAW